MQEILASLPSIRAGRPTQGLRRATTRERHGWRRSASCRTTPVHPGTCLPTTAISRSISRQHAARPRRGKACHPVASVSIRRGMRFSSESYAAPAPGVCRCPGELRASTRLQQTFFRTHYQGLAPCTPCSGFPRASPVSRAGGGYHMRKLTLRELSIRLPFTSKTTMARPDSW